MRKVSLMAASLACLSVAATANADEQAGKVYYKEGTRIEMQDFDLKINIQLQPKFSYVDNDDSGRADNGIDKKGDTDSFDLRRARLIFSGNILNKQFSYKIKTDLRSSEGGSDLKEAWLQWNGDSVNARFGQFKVPFSRQENGSSGELQMIDRSAVSDFFSPSYQPGAMIHGPVAEGINYYLGSYNGQSDGEGRNKAGVDNKLAVDAALTATFNGYGSRGGESDLREDQSSTGLTTGIAAIYSQGFGDPAITGTKDDFDRFDLNVDGGLRSNGFSAQTEFYFSHVAYDLADSDADVFGFYVQGGYVIDKLWEVAGRFGYIDPDSESTTEDQEEYNLVLSYFIKGHSLKIQTGVTWLETNYNSDSDTDSVGDFRFETQLSGYF